LEYVYLQSNCFLNKKVSLCLAVSDSCFMHAFESKLKGFFGWAETSQHNAFKIFPWLPVQ